MLVVAELVASAAAAIGARTADVDRLADRWGSAAHDDGKVVWTELPLMAPHLEINTGLDQPEIEAGEARRHVAPSAERGRESPCARVRGSPNR